MILQKETALFDTGAIDTAITEAGQTASKYLSADSSGIMVYDGSNGEQKPSTVTSTTNNVFIDDNSVDVRKGTATLAEFTGTNVSFKNANGDDVAKFGTYTVLGSTSSSNLEIGDNAITWFDRTFNRASIKYDPAVPCLHFRDKPVKMDALQSNIFTVTTEELFASTNITANSHAYSTKTITKSGYYPLAIAGWNSPDMRYFVPARLRLSSQSEGSATVSFDIYNAHSSAHIGAFNVDILWLKVTP